MKNLKTIVLAGLMLASATASARDLVFYNGSYSEKVVEIFDSSDNFVGAWRVSADSYLTLDIGYNYCSQYKYKVRGSYGTNYIYDCSEDITYK